MVGVDALSLGNVRVDADGIAEMDGRTRLVFVPREEIIGLELVRGSGAQRPLVTLVLGILLLGIAVLPVVMVINWLRRGGVYPTKIITAAAFVVPAFWLLDLSLRPRWYLRVRTRRGSRKLLFPKDCEHTAAESFLSSVRERFGYGRHYVS